MGKLEDLQYLLYFRTVQQKVKDAWTFPGGSNDLSADVEFSIGADGALNSVKIAKSSGDSAFDESVLRALRRAAPFSAAAGPISRAILRCGFDIQTWRTEILIIEF